MGALLAALFAGCAGSPPLGSVRPAALPTVVHPTAAEIAAGQALDGSYIVTFRAPPEMRLLSFPSYFAEYRAHHELIAEPRLSDPRVKDIQFLTSIDLAPATVDDASPLLQLAWSKAPGEPTVGSIARVDFVDADGARAALDDWEKGGELWFAEPNYVSRTSVAQESLFKKLATEYGAYNAWWLTAINLPQAFDAIAARDLSAPGTPSDADIAANAPIVAVLDSGVDYEHPALKNRMWVNTDLNSSNCDNDLHGCNTTAAKRGRLGNGDVWPYDTSGPGQDCVDKDTNCSHGTHVAGIIAADHAAEGAGPGSRPVAGMCPVCRIMVLKIVSKVGKESGILDSAIIAAFKYVALFKRQDAAAVRVINASFGKFVRSRAVGLLVRLLKDKRGTLIVAAAGNEDTLTMEYPAAFADAVAVAAVDTRLRKVSFSNFGHWVDVSAPGQGILSTVPGNAAEAKSGTSMATPMVAGIAGLLLARYPDMSFSELFGTLTQSADPKFYRQDFEEGFNFNYYYPKLEGEDVRQPLLGLGLLNAFAAVNRTASEGLPLFSNEERVTARCGTTPEGRAPRGWTLLAFLALPLLATFYKRQVIRAMFR